jgi:hypothetical protein
VYLNLNFRYLGAVFSRLGHPLKKKLETLKKLNMGRCIAGYSNILPLNIVSSESFTLHELPLLLVGYFVDDHMKKALCGVGTVYSVVAPREL